MAEIVYLNFPTSLLGRWSNALLVEGFEDVGVEYTIAMDEGRPNVTGISLHDGEAFVITNISYARDRLEFDTLMPSTQRSGHVTLIKRDRSDKAEMRFTFSDRWLAHKQAREPRR